LASGKGVFLPDNFDEAECQLREIFVEKRFGDAGNEVIIEDRLYGEEASILAFCDGYTAIPLPAVQDHKRVFDNDQVRWNVIVMFFFLFLRCCCRYEYVDFYG
jgi:phosphoribosylamine-glycine ligase